MVMADKNKDSYKTEVLREKLSSEAVLDGRYGHKQLRMTDEHLPAYMKIARKAQLDKVLPDNQSKLKAYRKAMNDNVV